MPQPTQETIHDLLVKNVPREVVMGVEDALTVGAQRAYMAARGMDEGHLPHAVGQLRHFHMNEAFQRALATNGAEPSPIRGNGIVTGRTGVFTLARFNIPEGFWINGRRSHTVCHSVSLAANSGSAARACSWLSYCLRPSSARNRLFSAPVFSMNSRLKT